jgi:hypothetical protein
MTSTKPADKIFPVKTFLSDIPTDLLPSFFSSKDDRDRGRLVIVGDVHGMRKSLETLLEKVRFDKCRGDHLIFVGDLINKGPDSPGVIDLAMKLGARAVRGNHENAVLNAAAALNFTRESRSDSSHLINGPDQPIHEPDLAETTTQSPDIVDTSTSATNTKKPSPATQSTALALSKHQIEWLTTLPLILRIKLPNSPKSSLGDTLLVAHAGLVPGISPEQQDPYTVTHIRSLVRAPGNDGFTPAESSGEEGWAVEWDRWQETLPSKTTVVFGHDAKRRLQLGKYTIGLDSACLYGHRLSALVIAASDGQVKHEVVQVECQDVPVAPNVSVEEGNK